MPRVMMGLHVSILNASFPNDTIPNLRFPESNPDKAPALQKGVSRIVRLRGTCAIKASVLSWDYGIRDSDVVGIVSVGIDAFGI